MVPWYGKERNVTLKTSPAQSSMLYFVNHLCYILSMIKTTEWYALAKRTFHIYLQTDLHASPVIMRCLLPFRSCITNGCANGCVFMYNMNPYIYRVSRIYDKYRNVTFKLETTYENIHLKYTQTRFNECGKSYIVYFRLWALTITW